MRPPFPIFNSAYGVLINPIISGNQSLQTIILSNFINLFLSKFCRPASFSAISGSVFNFVGMIVFRSIPSKIIQMIVIWVAVVVAAFHTNWSRPYKSIHNQFMRLTYQLPIVFPQRKIWTQIMFVDCNFFKFTRLNRLNLTAIRNLIYSFKTYYIAPLFHNNSRSNNMGIL